MSKYLRQEANTEYCMLLACLNARAFYGLKTIDPFGKNKRTWKNLLQKSGAVYGPPTLAFPKVAKLFDLIAFRIRPSLKSLKKQLSKNRCVMVVSEFNGDLGRHAYLVIKVTGKDLLTCVNYAANQRRTVMRIKWDDLRFKYLIEHPTQHNVPSSVWGYFDVLLPKSELSIDLMAEIDKETSLLIKSVYCEGRVYGETYVNCKSWLAKKQKEKRLKRNHKRRKKRRDVMAEAKKG